MLPRFADHNSTGIAACYAKHTTEGGITHSVLAMKPSHLTDVLGSQLRVTLPLATDASPLRYAINGVVEMRPNEQVVRVEAPGVVTPMQNTQRVVYWMIEIQPRRHPVNVRATVVDADAPVGEPPLNHATSPYPAAGIGVNSTLPHQSRFDIFGDESPGGWVNDNLGGHGSPNLSCHAGDVSASPGFPIPKPNYTSYGIASAFALRHKDE